MLRDKIFIKSKELAITQLTKNSETEQLTVLSWRKMNSKDFVNFLQRVLWEVYSEESGVAMISKNFSVDFLKGKINKQSETNVSEFVIFTPQRDMSDLARE